MEVPKIVSLGAAVQDVFLTGKVFKAHTEDGEKVEEFKLGEKYDVEGVTFSTGGGATNGSVTFARQGLDASFFGVIGDDPAGQAILADLVNEGVDTDNVSYSDKYSSGYSVLLVSPSGERVVLTYRGASSHYSKEDFNFSHMNGDWLFVTSVAGCTEIIEEAVSAAKLKKMKVAMIPGKGELRKPEWIKANAKHFDIFSANKEETASLVQGESPEQLAVNMHMLTGGITVVTDGPNGVAVTDGKEISSAGMYEDVPVQDRTGAGDAFASGFTAAIAMGRSIEEAITLGSANSTSVVSYVGAKKGILDKSVQLHEMAIRTSKIHQE